MSENQTNLHLEIAENNGSFQQISHKSDNNSQHIGPKNNKISGYFKGLISGVIIIILLIFVVGFFEKERIIDYYIPSSSNKDCVHGVSFNQINEQNINKENIDEQNMDELSVNYVENIDEDDETLKFKSEDLSFTATPLVVYEGERVNFEVNYKSSNIFAYSRNFGDQYSVSAEYISSVIHRYSNKGTFLVTLKVVSRDGSTNEYQDYVFIGEKDYPVSAFKVRNHNGFIHPTDICKIKTASGYQSEYAYPINRYEKFNIDSSISINTKGTSQGLKYQFKKEKFGALDGISNKVQFDDIFSRIGCHYIDLKIIDKNTGKEDKKRIWFNVKNSLPTIKNLVLTFPQYSDNMTGFIKDSNNLIFDCSGATNLLVKVSAIEPQDIDGNISRLKFYYYDDSERILEYKEATPDAPYAYFSLPKVGGKYKFGVRVYDNDGDFIDSDDYFKDIPTIYISESESCNYGIIPIVTLKLSSQDIQVGDTITYSIISKISKDNEDFEEGRMYYYDFTGDGIWDLVTHEDSVAYTFEEAYEDGVRPKVAVEYRKRIGESEGNMIIVKNNP